MRNLKLVVFVLALPWMVQAQIRQGISLDLMYPTVNNLNSPYVGRALGGVSVFRSGSWMNWTGKSNQLQRNDFMLELGYHFIGSRNKNIDYRYTDHLLEGGVNWMFAPYPAGSEFRFIVGLKAAYLLSPNSEKLDQGNWVDDLDAPSNHNSKGDLFTGLNLGISLAVSPFMNLDVKYVKSFQEQSTDSYMKGRFSTAELSLRMNMYALGKSIEDKKKSAQSEVLKFTGGTLLVMLETFGDREIQRLQRLNRANEISAQAQACTLKNKKVMQAFKKVYNLNRVLYFYDTSAYAISAGNYAGLIYDEQLQLATLNDSSGTVYLAAVAEDVSGFSRKLDLGIYFYDRNMHALGKPFNTRQSLMSGKSSEDILDYFRKTKKEIDEYQLMMALDKFQVRIKKTIAGF